MSEPQYGRYDGIARRWLALIERRQENFLELCDTGRWRHYYTEAQFLDEMRKVLRIREQWAVLAGVSLTDDELPPNHAVRAAAAGGGDGGVAPLTDRATRLF